MTAPVIIPKESTYLDHEVLVHKDLHRPAGRWCEQQFGRRWEAIGHRSGRWCMFWAGPNDSNKYRFCFADEQDMMWFMLQWS